MKEKDLLLVTALRKDCRQPIVTLSCALQVCRATVTERLEELQKTIIQKYTALLDFKQLGYQVKLLVGVKLPEYEKEIFSKYIQQHGCVNNLYKGEKGVDYVVEMVFKTKEEADQFLVSLEHAFCIEQKQVFFIERDVLREIFFDRKQKVLRQGV